jgi:ribosomal protein S12 methylthiotransferase accessory factor
LSQNNIVDPENRYKQIFKIQVELPADISEKDRQGILRSIDRCTVKKVIQTGPEFIIEEVESIDADAQALLMPSLASESSTICRERFTFRRNHCQYVRYFGWSRHEN